MKTNLLPFNRYFNKGRTLSHAPVPLRYWVAVIKRVGSLKDVSVEQRTSTGSGLLALLGSSFCPNVWVNRFCNSKHT